MSDLFEHQITSFTVGRIRDRIQGSGWVVVGGRGLPSGFRIGFFGGGLGKDGKYSILTSSTEGYFTTRSRLLDASHL